jgi:ABC-type bacteriocin/lantibiotic exporter with double-glycine peptidase domain
MKNLCNYIKRSISLLEKRERRKYLIYLMSQSILGLLDILGIAVVGLMGFTAINGYSGTETTGLSGSLLSILGLTEISFNSRVLILGCLAVGILLTRTIITIQVTRRGLRFLALATSLLTVRTFSKFINSPYPQIQKLPTQEAIFLLTTGMNRLVLGVLGSTITLTSDVVLVFLILVSLFIVDVQLAISVIVLFLILGLVLRRFSGNRTTSLTSAIAVSGISINSTIRSAIENFREISVKSVKPSYVSIVDNLATEASLKEAEVAFLPLSSKYIIESSLVLITFTLGGVQFLLSDAKNAIATLALFMAAGARVLPALLRIQQSLLSIQASVGTSDRTWDLIERTITNTQSDSKMMIAPSFEYVGFNGAVYVENLRYRHQSNQIFSLEIDYLEANPGEMIAIVGTSGAGKSTFADLILGILLPESGTVQISGMTPSEAVNNFPGSIAYIPQKVFIDDCSVKENISLGFDQQRVDDNDISEVLKLVHLDEWVKSLKDGIYSGVGESGYSMSGGQQQRLGIARALYTKPKLILMDEATSALDGQTEADISESIQSLKGEVTVIVIAHRLSTIKDADQVVLLDSGKILAQGKFDEVRQQVPDFDEQAKIMGL